MQIWHSQGSHFCVCSEGSHELSSSSHYTASTHGWGPGMVPDSFEFRVNVLQKSLRTFSSSEMKKILCSVNFLIGLKADSRFKGHPLRWLKTKIFPLIEFEWERRGKIRIELLKITTFCVSWAQTSSVSFVLHFKPSSSVYNIIFLSPYYISCVSIA